MRWRRTHPTVDPNAVWSRGQLLALVLGTGLAVLVVLAGLGLSVARLARPQTAAAPAPTTKGGVMATPVSVGEVRDRAAAAAMPSPAPGAQPSVRATGAVLRVPQPSVLRGPGGVPAGFPHTAAGAVAQLAAVDQTVLTAMNPQTARDVYQAWALPGGVGTEDWVLTRSVDSFNSTLAASSGRVGARVTADPAGALVKATDGPDWVVACVLLDVRATVKVEARLGFGHCERMQWDQGRWQIAPGAAPTQPAPVTPNSQAAAAAGWLVWASE